MNRLRHGFRLFVSSAAVTALCGLVLAEPVWTGLSEDDDNWSSAANWSEALIVGGSTTAGLQFDGSNRTNPYIDTAWTVKTLTYNAGADSFSFYGEETLTFAPAAVITNNSSSMQFFENRAVVLNGASTWNAASADFAVNAVISGAGSIIKTGDGTLVISGANTYSGGTTVSAGVLHFGSGSLGSGAITINGGQLRWGEGNTDALSGAITLGANGGTLNTNGNDVGLTASLTGAGNFTKAGSGILTLNTAGNSTGTTTVTGGTLRLGVAGALPGSKALVINAADESGAAFDLNGYNLTVSSLRFGGANETAHAVNALSTGSGTLTLGGNVTYSLANGNEYNPGAAFISGKLALGGTTRTFTINDSTNTNAELTISAIISGTGGLTKAGNGALVLSGTNTYTGNTTVNGGALRISSASNLPSTTNLQLNGGVIELAGDVALTYGTGAGQVQFTGSGGFSAFGGDRSISYQNGALLTWATSGFVANNKSLMLSSLSSDSMVTLANNIALGSAERTVQVADGSAAIDATLSGVLSGTGSLKKTGSGTLRLSGANTYTTKTTVSEGTLLFATTTSFHNGQNANWTAAKLIVAGGATAAFNVGGTGEFTAANITTFKGFGTSSGGFQDGAFLGLDTTNAAGGNFDYSAAIGNTNSGKNALGLAKLGSGTLTLSGTNTYTGGTSLRGGILSLGSSGAIGNSGNITFLGGTLQFTSSNKKDYSARFTDDANQHFKLDTNGQSVTLASALTGFNSTLTKLGAGTLTLSGADTNDGLAAIVDAGTLLLAKASSDDVQAVRNGLTINSGGTAKLGGTGGNQIADGNTVTVNSGGVLDLGGRSETIGALNGAGTVTNSTSGTTSTLTIGEYGERDSVFSGVLKDGAGVLALHHIESATLTLSGTNTYTGGTTLSNDGVVVLGSAGALGTTGTITLNGGTLRFSEANTTDYSARFSTADEQRYNIDTNGQSVTFAAALSSDQGSLVKLGAGTLTLAGANSYTGETIVRGGTLALTNDQALGTADGPTIVEQGATLELNNVAIGRETIVLSGAGVGGNGALVGKGISSLSGDIDVGDDVIINTTTGAFLSLNGGVNNAFTKIGAGTLILGGDVDNGGLSIVANAGTVVLAKDSSEDVHAISGRLTINHGVILQLAGTGDDQIHESAFVELNSGGLFDLNGRNEGFAGLAGTGTVTNRAAGTTSRLGIGAGDGAGNLSLDVLLQDGAGVLALETLGGEELVHIISGANTYTGGTTLTGGTLNLASAGAIGTEGTITFNGGTLQFTAANTTDYSARFSSETGQQYKFDTNGQSVTFASAITGAEGYFQKLGDGILTLSGENTLDSWIDILQGTLKVTHDSALGASGFLAATYIYDGATLELSHVTTEEVLVATGDGVDGKGAIYASDSSTLSGVIIMTDNTSIGVASGKSLVVTNTIGTDQIPEAALTKTGSGTLVLSGENSYAGETRVNGGTLLVNGSNESSQLTTVADGATLGGYGTVGSTVIHAGGTFAPGESFGLLTVNGDLTFEAGSLARFEIGGLVRGIDYDAVNVSGVLKAHGTLTIVLSGDFTPTEPGVFDLFDFEAFEGSFTEIYLPTIEGYAWDTSNLGIDGTIALVASAIPEPSSFAIFAGLASVVFVSLRRRRV